MIAHTASASETGAAPVPPAPEPAPVEEAEEEAEVYEPQPYVEGQPTIFEPNPPPAKVKRTPMRKRTPKQVGGAPRRVRRKKPE